MPRVPVYEAPQETLRPIAGVPVDYGQPGNDAIRAGNAIQRAAGVLGDISLQEQNRRNADRIFQAEGAIKADYVNFETGLQNRKGQQAWGVTGDVQRWWDENERKVLEALDNDVQRTTVKQTLAKLRLQSVDAAGKYEDQQRRISVEESAKSSIVGSINLAAAQHSDPAALSTAKNDVVKRVQVLSQLNGWTPERAAIEEQQNLTNLHKQVLQAKIDADPDGAATYYRANKGEIAGTERAEIEKAIGIGTRRAKAQEATDTILARGLSEADALAEVRKKHSGEDEDEIARRVKERYADQAAARERDQRDAADTAWRVYAQSGSLDGIPTTVLNRMDGQALAALRRDSAARTSGDAVKTDWSTFYELKQMAGDNATGFAQVDLRRYFGSLAPEERRSLINLQEQASKPDTAKDVATLEQQLSRAHDLLGWKSSDAESKGQFDSTVYQALDQAQQTAGRKLTFKERQEVIDRMMVDGEVVSGNWYAVDRNRRYYEVQGTDDSARFVPNIPATERQKIAAALQRAGKPATDDAVMALYKAKNKLP